MQKGLAQQEKSLHAKSEEAKTSLDKVVVSKTAINIKTVETKQAKKEVLEKKKQIEEIIANVDEKLANVLPMLEEAMSNIKAISPKDIALLKSLGHPPEPVKMSVTAFVILLADNTKYKDFSEAKA